MANWCYNVVQFSGDEQKIKEIDALFNEMSEREKQAREGQLPSFVEADTGYLFDIYVQDGYISYETKWAPNTDVLVQIADHFQTGFIHEYQEPGMCIFGEATYQDKELVDISLDDNDLELFHYEDDIGYVYEGQTYESDVEIMELLLEKKKGGLDSPRGYGR
ncbi:DUF1281 family ferredoxin-like fold protein [Sphingobacterium cellulitidis]|uniref:DUF1281 family ferredoxin-like fold protein n=1 Tax=Sphingobacterium cellulitidis TaxID=1768011 RepID=UPI000B93F9B2|nr:hypothetical protein CHT99_01350 [Sphingobacterium cellulitidis]